MAYLSVYLPIRLGTPIAKASKLVSYFGGGALEGGLKGGVAYFELNTFKIELTLADFSKLPALGLTNQQQ